MNVMILHRISEELKRGKEVRLKMCWIGCCRAAVIIKLRRSRHGSELT